MSNHPFRPLRRRSVQLIWGAGVVSDAGTWVQLIVVGSLVARNTNSAFQTGLIALATFMPQGLSAPIGGLLADRFDRRKVFACALTGQAIATALLAALLGSGVRSPPALAGMILCASVAGSLGAPSYAAMLPDLVPPEELMAMLALGIYSWNAGRIVGPVVGTVMARAAGPSWTVTLNAVTFAGLVVAVLLVRRPFAPHDGEQGSIRERLVDGWVTARSVPSCAFGLTAIVLLNVCVGPFTGLIPAFARSIFHGGTAMAGAFSCLQGLGAIVGAMAVTALAPRYGRTRLIAILVASMAVSYLGYGLSPRPWIAGVFVMFVGASVASLFTTMTFIIQRDAPAAHRGRVMATMQGTIGFSFGVGIVILGAIGDLANLRVAFAGAAILFATLALLLNRRLPQWRTLVDHPQVALAGTAAIRPN